MSRLRDEAGMVAAELAAGLGLLVLPIALLVVSLPVWSEVGSMARVAAQQAARAAVLADSDAEAAAAAQAAAAQVAANHGRALAAPVSLAGTLRADPGDAAAAPQQLITATVTVELPLVALPFIGDVLPVGWQTSHSQPVDVYRSFS